MSTKSSIAHGPNFHLYAEMFDNADVYLELESVKFEASERGVTVAIPVAVWEVIRRHTAVDLSFADKTDDDIRHLVEAETEERCREFAKAGERKKHILRISGAFIYGQPDEPRETQIANGLDYYQQVRARQSTLKQDIADLQNLQRKSPVSEQGIGSQSDDFLDEQAVLAEANTDAARRIAARLIELGKSGGNLDGDLELNEACDMQVKARLATKISEVIQQCHLSHPQAAAILGVSEQEFSGMLRGQFSKMDVVTMLEWLVRLYKGYVEKTDGLGQREQGEE